jgi:hypothetical protein
VKTKVGTAQNGTLSISVPNGGIPALRLVKWHAPHFRVECTDDAGATHTLPLSDIDLDHDKLASLNTPPRPLAALAR